MWDMLDHARQATRLAQECSWEEFTNDRTRQLAAERLIEIIGEAARNVPELDREVHPAIPWRKAIGMRHLIAHEYRRVNYAIVWEVLTLHLPELILQLEPLFQEGTPEDA
jgi:uncharacterized protein with HEPN domain